MPEPGPYRILLTGSRDWRDVPLLAWHLGRAVGEGIAVGRTVIIVHGACNSGADAIADRLAAEHLIEREPHPVTDSDWDRYGKAAGPKRNAEMVRLGADACLCFAMPCTDYRCRKSRPHDSHGASDCADRAEAAGIETRRIRR